MFTLTHEKLLDPTFFQSVGKLANAQGIEGKVARVIGITCKTIQEKRAEVSKEMEDVIIKEFGVFEDGAAKPVLDPSQKWGFKVQEEKRDAFEDVRKAFCEKTIELPHGPWAMKHFKTAGFTPLDYINLDELVLDVD